MRANASPQSVSLAFVRYDASKVEGYRLHTWGTSSRYAEALNYQGLLNLIQQFRNSKVWSWLHTHLHICMRSLPRGLGSATRRFISSKSDHIIAVHLDTSGDKLRVKERRVRPAVIEFHFALLPGLGASCMDWVDTTDDTVEAASALRQAFEVLRPVPTQATARVQKVQTGKGKDKHQALLQGKLHLDVHLSPDSART